MDSTIDGQSASRKPSRTFKNSLVNNQPHPKSKREAILDFNNNKYNNKNNKNNNKDMRLDSEVKIPVNLFIQIIITINFIYFFCYLILF